MSGVTFVTLLLGLWGITAFVGTPAPAEAADQLPISIDITVLTPHVVTASSTLTVHGLLTNRGEQTQYDLRVVLGIGGVIRSRSALAGADASPPQVELVDGHDADSPTLVPGQPASSFSFAVPVSKLKLGDLGVYPLQIQARSDDGVVGLVTTYLPWFPDGVAAPTRIAWVWPLVDTPRRGPGDVLRDDGLADELASGGRLRGLLDAARDARRQPRPVQVTLAIDPDLLDTVALMATTPYQVETPHGGQQRGRGTGVARAWLGDLRALVQAGDPVLALPYADPDAVALEQAGLGPTTLATAVDAGRATVTRLLPHAKLTPVGWPPGEAVTVATLDDLEGTKDPRTGRPSNPLAAVLLNEAALPLAQTHSYTVGARAPLDIPGQTLDALVIDDGIGQILSRPARYGPGPLLAEQRFIVETAMLNAERPNDRRDVVIAPPRRWQPAPSFAERLLTDSGGLPWLAPSSLDEIEQDPIPDNATRKALRYPDQAAARELPSPYLRTLSTIVDNLTNLGTILADHSVLAPAQHGVWRSASSAWREDLAAGRAIRHETATAVTDLVGAVRVTSGRQVVTLTSFTGTVPITIANELPSDVVVRVRVDARNRARLQGGASSVQLIPAHRVRSVPVKISAAASGEFPIYVSLASPKNGALLGERVSLRVNVTAYGRLALAITGAALGVLLIAVGIRITRRALRTRRVTV